MNTGDFIKYLDQRHKGRVEDAKLMELSLKLTYDELLHMIKIHYPEKLV